MIRNPNTTRNGSNFDSATISAVWNKARIIPGYNSDILRKDSCGAWIRKDQYGQLADNGWEIDHIHPVSKGGSDSLENLQPLQWSNNRHKGDNYPSWSCAVSAK